MISVICVEITSGDFAGAYNCDRAWRGRGHRAGDESLDPAQLEAEMDVGKREALEWLKGRETPANIRSRLRRADESTGTVIVE
jgi:hypothetical protein